MDKVVVEKLENFFGRYKQQNFRQGEVLIRADDNPQGIYYLKEGVVKQYAISKKGEELVVNIFKSSTFFPMSWAINNTENAYYYEAVTDAEVYRATKEEVVGFIKNNPDVLFDLTSRVYIGIDGLLTRMVYLMAGSAHPRLVAELLIQAKRFGEKVGGAIHVKLSEKDIANQSGLARETVSREMKVLKDKGLVFLDRNTLMIKSIEKLEKELSL